MAYIACVSVDKPIYTCIYTCIRLYTCISPVTHLVLLAWFMHVGCYVNLNGLLCSPTVQLFFLGVTRRCNLFARNVAKLELDSASATVARNVANKVAPCVCAWV